ncbi:MAG: sigma-70 family RNA polymerase sigma factor [Opitutaceae bacterium]|nr:sigma-70 family RNA polymerase sigma factor [Opitutaceae bacterium]
MAQAVDHLFRREAGRLVAILARRLGAAHLHLAEDVVQDALVKAMETWPFTGVPPNPTAWILQTARNRAIDQTRRASVWRGKQSALVPLVEDCLESALTTSMPQFEDEIRDSQLRMMFVCCHPALAPEMQVALTLKTLCGFGEREIAAAFLTSEDAVTKRLVRARQLLREKQLTFELPRASQLGMRVDGVQQALYLLFNEGYKASQGDSLLRTDLCAEALRLGELLAAHPAGDRCTTRALLALMYFNAARLPARVDDAGSLLLLAEQDRTLWSGDRIQAGFAHLAASGAGAEVSRFHLEAGIAACHSLASSYATTDWRQILSLYDQLMEQDASPVVALNRAVAVARVQGAAAGLRALDTMPRPAALQNHHLRHAVAGQLWFEAGDRVKAAACFRQAHELATVGAERDFLARRLAEAETAVDRA